MATEKQIEDIILGLAGKPSSGAIKNLAPIWARAIVELDKVPEVQEKKEKRVTDSEEIR